MKKLFSLILLLVLLLTAAGCGKSEDLTGSGTEADPYRIATAEQLFQMAGLINSEETHEEYSNAHYLITADIDLGGKKWEPIGTYSVGFQGVLDGGGHTVSGFRIKEGKIHRLGFIAELSKGAVKNLTVSDATVSGTADSSQVAAIVGSCLNGTVENCHTTDSVTVTSTCDAAGICANYNTDSPLVGCSNAATVTSEKSISGTASGIVHRAGGAVIDCSNSGTVTSNGDAAGITSHASGGLSGCVNSGSVTARNNAAGIVVSFDDGALNSSQNNASVTLENCVNSGAVTSTEDTAGGIAAACRTGTVKNCVNSGPVSAPRGAGGIFSYFQRSAFGTPATTFTVSGCINSGTVTVTATAGNEPVGGICCRIVGSEAITFLFENCENSGTLLTSGQKNVAGSSGPAGGIVGVCDTNSITFLNCANSGSVTGVRSVGGIVGQIEPADPANIAGTVFLAENCANSGDLYVADGGGLTTEIYCGGIAGTNGTYRQSGWVSFETLTYSNCSNTGSLSGDTDGAPLRTHELCGSLMSDIQ